MKKILLTVIITIFCITFSFGQIQKIIQLDKKYSNFNLSKTDSTQIKCQFLKDHYYSFIVESQGIYLTVDLRDTQGNPLGYSDYSPTIGDPAKINFSPNITGEFSLMVKRKESKGNPKKGNFSIIIKKVPNVLKKYSLSQLTQDFDILKNAYIETRVGFWYNNAIQFDSICKIQKQKLKENMNSIEFYRIVAPVVSFTKEGHSKIYTSEESETFLNQNGKYLPIIVKILDSQVYLLNNIGNSKAIGSRITKINGIDITKIINTFLNVQPSDGFNITGKYHRIERTFADYYASLFDYKSKTINIEIIDLNGNKKNLKSVSTLTLKEYLQLKKKVNNEIPYSKYKSITNLKLDSIKKIATLTVNSFNEYRYKNGAKGFKRVLQNSFDTIIKNKMEHLIIDIRKNEGGLQGMEDYLLSYLINNEYIKYKYVEIPAFNFSFLKYSEHNNKNLLAKSIENRKQDFFQDTDGRYIAKKGIFKSEKPKGKNFKGDVYILINGLTFSGGSEFAALASNYTKAKFIGEETGGGYYGNTSGKHIWLILPNTKLLIGIPIEKYVLKTIKNNIPFGRGIVPDYQVQPTITEYLNGIDTELEFAKKLISN